MPTCDAPNLGDQGVHHDALGSRSQGFGRSASKALDCRYADGAPPSAELIDDIRHSIHEPSVSFPWCRGDLLLIDNLRTGRGRSTYSRARQILAALVAELSRH